MRFRLFLLCLVFSHQLWAQKKIVITVDDLPGVTNFYRTPDGRLIMNQKLIRHFQTHRVPAIGFVISQWLYQNGKGAPDPNQVNVLKAWLDAGLELGNHTFSHKDFTVISIQDYFDEVTGGEKITKKLVEERGKPFRFFRHPYLRKGETPAKKDSLERFLVKHNYREAPVTVDNYDFLFSHAYDNALLKGDSASAVEIGRQYLDYMTAYVRYYEAQSDSLFKRQIPQSLLTHANTINAVYMGDLLKRLTQSGYTFISLEEALKDPAYRSKDGYIGKGGISWMHRWALTQGKKGGFFKGEPEVPAMVTKWAENP
ncbi:polysaccharide deacetylase family protein [Larkinella rosea]|uniref:Polysaccharide deacetylase n=1 Tax=Larkinella rosea TaxID=2025312 RepID=A0A3P1BD55_9BACT|nr:polysaccharide deacetylase family protein [Larkinella rosea]RRA98825.1 polysaccharide deacetylase [Larkinella rosea]